MLLEDVLERLRVDPGQKTLGQLLQDREAAAHEIRRLRGDIERLRAMRAPGGAKTEDAGAEVAMRPGMLVRLAELCELLGVARSTIYKWMSQGTFPPPVRISERAVRWRAEDIEGWREALLARAPLPARTARGAKCSVTK